MPDYRSFADTPLIIARALELWRVGVPAVETQPEWEEGAPAPAGHALAPAGLRLYSGAESGESPPPYGLVTCGQAVRVDEDCAEMFQVPVTVTLEFHPRTRGAEHWDYAGELEAVFCGAVGGEEPEARWTNGALVVDRVEKGEPAEFKGEKNSRFIEIEFTLLCRFLKL